jgi:mRNA interferase RelE/StbE
MNLKFDKSFDKDHRKIKDKKILRRVIQLIDEVELANSVDQIKSVRKLGGFKDYYRVRVGDYRIGLRIFGNTVEFIRILHRKDVYKYFP